MKTHRLQVVSSIEQGKGGVAFVGVVMALVIAACTRTQSLGAAGTPDGGDVRTSNDAGDAQPDLRADSVPDLAPDGQPDGGPDVPPLITCVDNGATYHAGDIIPRGSAGCLMSCLCLGNGTIGACTGVACPPDGSADTSADAGNRRQVATITVSSSDGSPEIDVAVWDDGSAERTIVNTPANVITRLAYPPGSGDVTLFLYYLQGSGDISGVGDPSPFTNPICGKLATFGTTTKVIANGVVTGDLQCLVDVTGPQGMMAYYSAVLSGMPNLFFMTAHLCLTTGGQLSSNLCCGGVVDFPDTCDVGACSCAPSFSESVETCVCPNGSCFDTELGCVGQTGACTVGDDQTCNDNPALNAFHGHCVTGGRCACITGSTVVAASGKCS